MALTDHDQLDRRISGASDDLQRLERALARMASFVSVLVLSVVAILSLLWVCIFAVLAVAGPGFMDVEQEVAPERPLWWLAVLIPLGVTAVAAVLAHRVHKREPQHRVKATAVFFGPTLAATWLAFVAMGVFGLQ
jgi:lysylphosphatidylglycerol synthetase-like protein (DUF2156 family)